MTRFFLVRLGWTLAVVWLAISATFVLSYALPADPARTLVGPHADAATVARVRHQLCLDRSFAVAYGCYVGRILRGDLGESFRSRRPVSAILRERAWPTVQLTVAALALQLALGVPLGILAAIRRGRALDLAVRGLALLGRSAPTFFVGPLLMYVAAYRLELLPVSGYGDATLDRLRHLVLPALTLALTGAATYVQVVRVELIQALGQDYVRTARAKGAGPFGVVVRHALRSVVTPVVTLIGLDLGALLGGAVVTESVFGWPGLGREAMLGVLNLDLPVVLGTVLVAAITVSLVSLIVDLACAALDPRARLW